MKKILAVFLLVILPATGLWAMNASRTINYQGRLTDNNNNPVADGNYVITFRLYNDPNAEVPGAKWSETQTAVRAKNGYFNVVLGGINAFYKSRIDFNQQYWLGVQVGADSEMSPRQMLNCVPMTINFDSPLGSIMAWHKNMPSSGMPPLPERWVECNGQVLTDTESIFNGQTIPNLNGALTGTAYPIESGGTTIAAMFLRGGTSSGVGQVDEFKSHTHGYTYLNVGPWSFAQGTWGPGTGTSQDSQVGPTGGSETRPVNMSVVWIMKIK